METVAESTEMWAIRRAPDSQDQLWWDSVHIAETVPKVQIHFQFLDVTSKILYCSVRVFCLVHLSFRR